MIIAYRLGPIPDKLDSSLEKKVICIELVGVHLDTSTRKTGLVIVSVGVSSSTD